MYRYINYIFWILIIIIGVTFTGINAHWVYLDYYFGTTHIFLPILLVITMAIGALLGIAAMSQHLMASKLHNRKLHKKLKTCEQEIQNLRNIPLRDH